MDNWLRHVQDVHKKHGLRFEALEGKCWNHPVLRGGRVYVRSDVEMACYELR